MLPLDYKMDKIGAQIPADVNIISITEAFSGPDKLTLHVYEDSFAPAQYKNMDDAAKLSSPSFQKMHAGVEITMGSTMQAGNMVRRKIEYELTIIDKESTKPLPKGKFIGPIVGLMPLFFKNSAVARSVLSNETKKKFNPFDTKVKTKEAGFSVALSKNNHVYDAQASFSSHAMAEQYKNELIKTDATLAESLHVIPDSELVTV